MELEKTSVKVEILRNERGYILPGQPSLNPSGRPLGSVSIKDKVRQYLNSHPAEMEKVVGHFVHKNRELMWQMLEGSPNAKTDVTSGGKPLAVNLIQFSDPDDTAQLQTPE